MPLNYVGQTAEIVSVSYSGMPAGTEVVFVDTTSGAKTPSQGNALCGDGSADIPIDPELPAGRYYLLAQSKVGEYLAQTVAFYLGS
jgi:hypothetical protein